MSRPGRLGEAQIASGMREGVSRGRRLQYVWRWFVAKASSQKFIARNRAPRVQIEYDVELYGAEKKIQLPFVMGVLADLSGKPAEALPPVADRKFLEIDVDNFDSRMKAMKPRVAFEVPEHADRRGQPERRHDVREHGRFLARGGRAQGRRAEQAARGAQQLSNLITYMDGKSGAEELIAQAAARIRACSRRWRRRRSPSDAAAVTTRAEHSPAES